MRSFADSGRRIDALRVYQAYRTLLAEEVGAEPSEAITRLERDIARRSAENAGASRVRVR
jgi:DNA-binding SARP family transcriptional activator